MTQSPQDLSPFAATDRATARRSAAPQPARAPKAPKPPSAARSALKFAFMPEFGRSLRPIKDAWSLFISVIAQLFVSARLIEKDHPCAKYDINYSFGLIDVIGFAWHDLKFTRNNIPKIMMFFAVVGFIIFVAMTFVGLLLQIFIGGAHADTLTAAQQADPANILLLDLFDLTSDGQVPKALGAMLAAYSKICLVFGGIILLFIIISVIAESANSGVPFGKNFNHTWAPIRLVVAIGLLIPLAGGLNSGQYIILNLVHWGSDSATFVWQTFGDTLKLAQASPSDMKVSSPRSTVDSILDMELCAARVNASYSTAGLTGGIREVESNSAAPAPDTNVAQTAASKPFAVYGNNPIVYKTISYVGSTASQKDACGSVTFPHFSGMALGNNSTQSASGTGTAIATGDPREYLMQARYDLYLQARTSLRPIVQQYAASFLDKSDPQYAKGFPRPSLEQYQSVLDNYNKAQKQYAKNASNRLQKVIEQTDLTKMSDAGWLGAPIWLYQIAQLHANLQSDTMDMPSFSNVPNTGAGSVLASLSQVSPNASGITTFGDSLIMDQTKSWGLQAGEATEGFFNNNRIGADAAYVLGDGDTKHGAEIMGGAAYILASGPSFASQKKDQAINYLASQVGCPNPNECINMLKLSSNNPIMEIGVTGQRFFSVGVEMIEGGLLGQAASNIPGLSGVGALGNFAVFIGLPLMTAGIFMGFLLIMMPMLRFYAGVLGWIMLVFQACFAVPLVALAMLSTKGEGLMGDTRSAYLTVLGIILRPILMVLGLVAGFLAFYFGAKVFNTLFIPAIAGTFNLSSATFFHFLVFLFVYAFFMFQLANSAFKMVDLVPTQVMEWIGGRVQSQGTERDADDVTGSAKQILTVAAVSKIDNVGRLITGGRSARTGGGGNATGSAVGNVISTDPNAPAPGTGQGTP